MIELTPRPVGALGETRPSWCPPASVPRDPCEIRYPVDIPLIGVEEVGIPVYRVVNDAMQAADRFLPDYLPSYYAHLQPYIAAEVDNLVRTAEYEADFLADKLLKEKVDPRVEAAKQNLYANLDSVVTEILATVVITGAASLIAIGVGAWWVNRREEIRDKR